MRISFISLYIRKSLNIITYIHTKYNEKYGGKIWQQKDREIPVWKILGIISSPSWQARECHQHHRRYPHQEDNKGRTVMYSMLTPSFNGCGVSLVTGLHGLNEGHFSMEIMNFSPPCWEELLDWIQKWEYGGRDSRVNWGCSWNQLWTCAAVEWYRLSQMTMCCTHGMMWCNWSRKGSVL